MPSGGSTKFQTWFSYMDSITEFMASSHSAESGPIICFLVSCRSIVVTTTILHPQTTRWFSTKSALPTRFSCNLDRSLYNTCSGFHFIHNRKLQNNFWCCATLTKWQRFSNLAELHCPPTHLFARKHFLVKSTFCDKHFCLRFGDRRNTQYFGITFEEALIRFWL